MRLAEAARAHLSAPAETAGQCMVLWAGSVKTAPTTEPRRTVRPRLIFPTCFAHGSFYQPGGPFPASPVQLRAPPPRSAPPPPWVAVPPWLLRLRRMRRRRVGRRRHLCLGWHRRLLGCRSVCLLVSRTCLLLGGRGGRGRGQLWWRRLGDHRRLHLLRLHGVGRLVRRRRCLGLRLVLHLRLRQLGLQLLLRRRLHCARNALCPAEAAGAESAPSPSAFSAAFGLRLGHSASGNAASVALATRFHCLRRRSSGGLESPAPAGAAGGGRPSSSFHMLASKHPLDVAGMAAPASPRTPRRHQQGCPRAPPARGAFRPTPRAPQTTPARGLCRCGVHDQSALPS